MLSKEEYYLKEKAILTNCCDSPTTILHNHEFIEIFYVINGIAKQILNNRKITIETGDLYLLRPNDIHQFKPVNSSPLLHRNFLIKKTEFQRICSFINNSLYEKIIKSENTPHVTLSIQQIENFEKQIELFSQSKSVVPIIIEILSLVLDNTVTSDYYMPSWLKELVDYIDRPQSFNKAVHELIEKTYRSNAYVCFMFKKYLGVNMTKYILNAKLEYAYSLIISSSFSISSIAEQCGFNSLTYFYKKFQEKYKVLPGKIRKKQ